MISSIHKNLFCAVAITLLIIVLPSFVRGADIPSTQKLALPTKCVLGRDCYIMHYVDLDPDDREVDFGCGRQTYNGHDGTDFGISDFETMKRGVPVLASAAGIVFQVRDGIADKLILDQTQKKYVKNFECGNGVVINHGNGWQTQYCHLQNGTVAGKKGDWVEKGSVLGMVGSSGLASFPHVHFSVRYQGKIVDPFVGITNISGCMVPRHPLWEKSPEYVSTGLINAGFSPASPTQTELWEGKYLATKLNLSDLPALIFWVHLFGVLQGDREHFTLIAPDKHVVVETEKTITKNNRSWVSYTGKKNSMKNPISKGIWRGVYQLKRNDGILVNLERVLVVE
jgi:murein DD-endopeptidase